MQTQGKIAAGESSRLETWSPETALYAPDVNEVRYSRGFLRAHPKHWFQTISAQWLPLFHTLGCPVSVTDVRVGLDFPENLDRITPVEVDGETAIVGLDIRSMEALVNAVSPGSRDAAALVIIEYLERRLISSLTTSWGGNSPLICSYIPPERTEAVEVVGFVGVTLSIENELCTVFFGLGPRLLERLDLEWREFVSKNYKEKAEGGLRSDELIAVSVELVELAVPPAMLIDYVRSGTVINLGVPVGSFVSIRANGELVAYGELIQCNGRFAVQIAEVDVQPGRSSNSTTRVQIEIARSELDRESLGEFLQVGAVLVTRTPLSPTASMVISGENVASAVIGQIDGQFALNVLPK